MDGVGREIRKRREEKGWTGAQLAVYANMSPSAVSQIETGRRSPNTASLTKLAEALGTEVADLFPKVQAPLSLEDTPAASTETLYNSYEFLGRVFASNWKDELEEWDEKIPTGTSPDLIDFGRLIEWSMGIFRTRHLYESVARHDGRPPRAELEDTLKLMENAEREAMEKVKTAFEPAKTYAEFQKIVKANNLEAILSSAEING